jgi:protein phosphatase PTC7
MIVNRVPISRLVRVGGVAMSLTAHSTCPRRCVVLGGAVTQNSSGNIMSSKTGLQCNRTNSNKRSVFSSSSSTILSKEHKQISQNSCSSVQTTQTTQLGHVHLLQPSDYCTVRSVSVGTDTGIGTGTDVVAFRRSISTHTAKTAPGTATVSASSSHDISSADIDRLPSFPAHSVVNQTANNILAKKGVDANQLTIDANSTLRQGVQAMVDKYVGSLLVLDQKTNAIAGMITERDILMALVSDEVQQNEAHVRDYMTPASRLICATPTDTANDCLAIMMAIGVRHLPVLDNDKLLGIIAIRDLIQRDVVRNVAPSVDTQNQRQSQSSKKQTQQAPDLNKAVLMSAKGTFISKILPRQGLPKTAHIANASGLREPVRVKSGFFSIAHPSKRESGGEDATFVLQRDIGAAEAGRPLSFTAMGVADGVGSWSFEKSVDPSKFSRQLMHEAEQVVSKTINAGSSTRERARVISISPQALLNQAWERVKEAQVPGSSTVCMLTIDGLAHQLQAVNLGDSGFIVVRRLTAEDAARDGTLGPKDSLAVTYRSPQQLHWFNCPAQLGIDEHGNSDRFELPHDAEHVVLQVNSGDVVILATDGVFDNMFESDILDVIEGITDDLSPETVAKRIALRAYHLSLSKERDGPFALLAKDNNIMWGGGRKDDITVAVAIVQSRDDEDDHDDE